MKPRRAAGRRRAPPALEAIRAAREASSGRSAGRKGDIVASLAKRFGQRPGIGDPRRRAAEAGHPRGGRRAMLRARRPRCPRGGQCGASPIRRRRPIAPPLRPSPPLSASLRPSSLLFAATLRCNDSPQRFAAIAMLRAVAFRPAHARVDAPPMRGSPRFRRPALKPPPVSARKGAPPLHARAPSALNPFRAACEPRCSRRARAARARPRFRRTGSRRAPSSTTRSGPPDSARPTPTPCRRTAVARR